MAKFNLDINIDDINTEEQLESYSKRGFRWRRTGRYGESMHIWPPNFMILSRVKMMNYIENIKLEFGNKDQIEMIEVARLMVVLDNAKHYNRYDLWDSDYFL